MSVKLKEKEQYGTICADDMEHGKYYVVTSWCCDSTDEGEIVVRLGEALICLTEKQLYPSFFKHHRQEKNRVRILPNGTELVIEDIE